MGRDDSYRWGDDPADHRELDAWLTRTPEEVWGIDDEEPVSIYTREQALADGVLVDATEAMRGMGLRAPAALTASAWATLGCDERARLRVALLVGVAAVVTAERAGHPTQGLAITLRDAAEERVAARVSLDGDGLTVMLAGED